MITISLGVRGSAPIQVENFRDEEASIVLMQQLERDAFDRVVENIQLRLSNMTGNISALFYNRISSTRFEVVIRDDGRVLFRGEVDNESISFDAGEEKVSFDVFSLNRLFWDRAKERKIQAGGRTGGQKTFETLAFILFLNLGVGGSDGVTNRGNYYSPVFNGDLFTGIRIGNGLETRLIRFEGDAGTLGNNGRYQDLDQNTTIYDLLTAMGVWYNAEFFIDPETEELVFQRRLVANGTVIDISGKIQEDSKIEAIFADRTSYDYIYTIFDLAKAPVPALDKLIATTVYSNDFNALVNPTELQATFYYYLTTVTNGVESAASIPLGVVIPGSVPKNDGTGSIFSISGYNVSLVIPEVRPNGGSPVTLPDVLRLYRTEIQRFGSTIYHKSDPYLLTEINDLTKLNRQFTYVDGLFGARIDLTKQMSASKIPLPRSAWIGYNEADGTWYGPIIDVLNGDGVPLGRIFNVLPKLSFSSQNTAQALSYSVLDIYSFFGFEYSLDTVKQDFQNLLVTARTIKFRVNATGFRVGDQITFNEATENPFKGTLDLGSTKVVKTAAIDINNEYTDLEVVCL